MTFKTIEFFSLSRRYVVQFDWAIGPRKGYLCTKVRCNPFSNFGEIITMNKSMSSFSLLYTGRP